MYDDIQIVEKSKASGATVPVDPVEITNVKPTDVPGPSAPPLASTSEEVKISVSTPKRHWQFVSNQLIQGKRRKLNIVAPESSFFDFYVLTPFDDPENGENGTWMTLKWDAEKIPAVVTEVCPDFTIPDLKVYMLNTINTSIDILSGFNNTGNIRIWPSEECLAWTIITMFYQRFQGKKILELGCGMTALAAMCASQFADTVVATDGNQISVNNTAKVIARNKRFNCKAVLHKWGDDVSIKDMYTFDYVIAADCLYEEQSQNAFIRSMELFLKPNGLAIIVSPSRSGTLYKFKKKIENGSLFRTIDLPELSSVVVSMALKLKHANNLNFDSDKQEPIAVGTVDEHFAHATFNALEQVKEELKSKGFQEIEFPEDVLMRVAGVAEAVLVHKWGKRLELIANHSKHSVITEEDVDLLFAHDPDFVARIETLVDTYDDPVDELAVPDKKSTKSNNQESTKFPAITKGAVSETEEDEEQDVKPVTSPESTVKVVLGSKAVIKVPSLSDMTKSSTSVISPKLGPTKVSPFSKPPVRSPFIRSKPSTPSRFTIHPKVAAPSPAITSPIVRPFPHQQRFFRSNVPETPQASLPSFRPLQPQVSLHSNTLTSPTVQNSRVPRFQNTLCSSSTASSLQNFALSTLHRPPVIQTPTLSSLRPTRPSSRLSADVRVQNRLPLENPVQRPFNSSKPSEFQPSQSASQKSNDSWNDDIVYTDLSNSSPQTPQAQIPVNQGDEHDSFDDDIIILEDSTPSTSAATYKRSAPTSQEALNVKRTKSATDDLQVFRFSDSDFSD